MGIEMRARLFSTCPLTEWNLTFCFTTLYNFIEIDKKRLILYKSGVKIISVGHL